MSNKNIILYIICVLFFVVFSMAIYSLWSDFSYKKEQDARMENDRKALIEKEKNYKKLFEKQNYENEIKDKNEKLEKEKNKPFARGKKTVHFILVYPDNINPSVFSSLTDRLLDKREDFFTDCNNNFCDKNASLNYVKKYLTDQSKKYNLTDFDLSVKTHGPYPINNLTQVGDIFANFMDRDPFNLVKLQDDFENLIKKEKIDVKPKEEVLFIYLDNSFQPAKGSNGYSFYENKKFRSYANDSYNKAYIDVYSFESSFSIKAVEIVIHELLHLYGASDKYLENPIENRMCSKSGKGDMSLGQDKAQDTGDIMCLHIEKDEKTFIRGSIKEENLIINIETAKEIGWIK